MKSPREFEVGQRIWKFDENRRIYERDSDGSSFGSPIFSEYFRPLKVVGIEGRSYLIAFDSANSARLPWKEGFTKAEGTYYSDARKDDAIWEKSYRIKIIDVLRRADADTLRKVAAVMGYGAATLEGA